MELQNKEETANITSAELKKKLEELESETKAEIATKDETIKQLATATISAEKIAQAEKQVNDAESSQNKAESRADDLSRQLEDEKKSHKPLYNVIQN